MRREICMYLDEMGLHPELSHHERGPRQKEIVFRFANPLAAADHFITFKSVVQVVAAPNGLYTSFLPKPLCDQNSSGLHVNLSAQTRDGNLFDPTEATFAQGQKFIAGILRRARELTAFLNPVLNSYARLPGVPAYHALTCARERRDCFVRIPAASGARRRIELRSPDPAVHPYLAFALLLSAGLEGP